MRYVCLILWLFPVLLAKAEPLIVGMELANNKPYEYLDAENRLTGFHVELVRIVAADLGWQVEFRRLPWKRVISSLESGDIHAATYVAEDPQRERFTYFLKGNLLHVNGAALYIKKSRADEIQYSPPIEAFVRKWKTGFPNGYYMGERITRLLKSDAGIETPTLSQELLFRMLLNDRYDVVFGSISALQLNNPEIQGIQDLLLQLPETRFVDTKMYIAFSRKHGPQMAEQFAAQYRLFRNTPAYAELAQRFNVVSVLPDSVEFEE
ncbi:MAG: transporter substrate-binding domain-containing protein [Pseudomonadales bacterium]|nr:transporter substrate-binding domain-containing protein [Pseudomonadales bacterium]